MRILFGFIFLCMIKDRIYISIRETESVLSDKNRLEALSFALCMKVNFRSSAIKNPTIRRCKELFHIGTSRMTRIMRNGTRYGFLRKEGNLLIASPIKKNCSYNYRLERKGTYKKNNEITFRLKDAMKMLREIILLNHISKQKNCSDTLCRVATAGKRATRSDSRRATRLCGDSRTVYRGLSNRKVMQVTNTKIYTARKLINELVSKKYVQRITRTIPLNAKASQYNVKDANIFNKENDGRGFIFENHGELFLHISNDYNLLVDNILIYNKK